MYVALKIISDFCYEKWFKNFSGRYNLSFIAIPRVNTNFDRGSPYRYLHCTYTHSMA